MDLQILIKVGFEVDLDRGHEFPFYLIYSCFLMGNFLSWECRTAVVQDFRPYLTVLYGGN